MKNQEIEGIILKLKSDLCATRVLIQEADSRLNDYLVLGLEAPIQEAEYYNQLKALEKDILDDLYQSYEVRNGFRSKPVPTSILAY